MKKIIDFLKQNVDIIALFLITSLVFLPYSTRLTYYLDDWYYIYNGIVAGPNIFHTMFSVDRPLRGYFFDLYFSLFGPQPFAYHLGMYLWHIVAGVASLLLFNLVWKNNRKFNFIAALLFVLYPGFSWWVSGIEYQPMMASLALQISSFFFTVKSIETDSRSYKIIYFLLSVLLGWTYIALVEYAIGMEAMRLFFVFAFVHSRNKDLTVLSFLKQKSIWIWSLVIPIGFIFWRFFFFENQRKATDINLQLSQLMNTPIDILRKWGGNFLSSFIQVNTSWVTQFNYQYEYSKINLLDLNWAIIIIVFILTTFSVVYIGQTKTYPVNNKNIPQNHQTSVEMLLIGVLGTFVGILPIIMVNRYINLTIYSHYGLPVSISAALILVGLISYIVRSSYVQYGVVVFLVTLATLAHCLIAEKTVFLKNVLEDFWWQSYWRIPNLYADTTLVTQYPDERVVDNELGLKDPANLIYFPQLQNEIPVRYPVSTLMINDKNITKILTGAPKKKEKYRGFEFILNYQNVLILSQPSLNSCMHLVDSTGYVVSNFANDSILKITLNSNDKNIRFKNDALAPPAFAFGEEPPHSWCFYYQKADLALQIGDIDGVLKLSDEFHEKGLFPVDKSEWAPFFIAYLEKEDANKLILVFEDLNSDAKLLQEFCLLTSTRLDYSESIKIVINRYCKKDS